MGAIVAKVANVADDLIMRSLTSFTHMPLSETPRITEKTRLCKVVRSEEDEFCGRAGIEPRLARRNAFYILCRPARVRVRKTYELPKRALVKLIAIRAPRRV